MDIASLVQTGVLLLAILGLGLKLEHRITKVETDVSWLKAKLLKDCSFNNNSKQ